MQGKPKSLGIVIPAHGHPVFLAEAIVSACEQDCSMPIKVVVVDDGCKFPETGQVAFSLQQKYPGKLYYFRQKNQRLPAARNAGVRFLLALEPNLDAVFFLDADNRLESYALESYRKALGDDEKIGWAYPDITFFGLSWSNDGFEIRETSRHYSKLKHLAGNISEAGSLVRADVFRKGLYFDETMRSGLEDWDFWLSLLEAGYLGTRVEQSGFLYRRRPESMLAASQRVVEGLQQRIRKKHPALYSPAHVMQLEHQEDPIFAIYTAGDNTIKITSDPLLEGETLSLLQFKEKLQARLRNELEYFFPDYLILLTPEEALRWKDFEKQLRWCFWKIKQEAFDVCQLKISVGKKFDYVHLADGVDTDPAALLVSQSHLKALTRQLLPEEQLFFAPTSVLSLHLPAITWGYQEVQFSEDKKAEISLPDALNSFVDSMREDSSWGGHVNRQYSGPAPVIIRQKLVDSICADMDQRPYTACSNRLRDTFVLSANTLESGQLSNITKLMQQSKAQDRETCCIIECTTQIGHQKLPVDWQSLVDDVVFYLLPHSVTEIRAYLGYEISSKLTMPQVMDVSVLARTSSRVFLVGNVASIEAAGEIRQYGIEVTATCLKVDPSVGRVLPKYLAYEHAIDRMIADSDETSAYMTASGFPAQKIMTWQALQKKT